MKDSFIQIKSEGLKGKRVAVCVTGSIAACESVKLLRELRRYGATPQVYMTPGAERFITPLSLAWAADSKVIQESGFSAEHVAQADFILVAPATLNTIHKFSFGFADNSVTTLLASAHGLKLPILFVPTMHESMAQNPIYLEKVTELKKYKNVFFMSGKREEGKEKLPNVEEIVSEVCHVLHQTTAFAKKRILITAGPTHGPVDAVRFLSNHSTGELGVLLAKRIYEAGGTPVLIYGPGTAVPQPYYRVESVTTPQEMMEVLTSEIQTQPYDAAIFSAAVLDHIPAHPVASKLSSNDELHIAFQKTPKLIREIDHVLKSRCENMTQKLYKIGFKLGVNQSRDELLKTAELAIEKMNVGLVVVNDLMEINHHQHHAYLVDRTFRVREVFTKDELVGELILHLKQKLNAL